MFESRNLPGISNLFPLRVSKLSATINKQFWKVVSRDMPRHKHSLKTFMAEQLQWIPLLQVSSITTRDHYLWVPSKRKGTTLKMNSLSNLMSLPFIQRGSKELIYWPTSSLENSANVRSMKMQNYLQSAILSRCIM